MFVKEVRKPDGEEYAPDIIYYLCLGKNSCDTVFSFVTVNKNSIPAYDQRGKQFLA